MSRQQANIAQISIIAERLGLLLSDVVFVGGTVTGFMMTDKTSHDVRPTDDVDLIIDMSGYAQYAKLQGSLRELGFQHDMNGPNCRFVVAGVKVDLMPTDESILGFSNKWYKTAIERAKAFTLPSGKVIRVISPEMFICTKLEAFAERGGGDFITSHDLADVIAVVNGRPEIVEEVAASPESVRGYLSNNFSNLLSNRHFLDSIEMQLPPNANTPARVGEILERLRAIAKL
jgi:predicted nucleotidyltransferase